MNIDASFGSFRAGLRRGGFGMVCWVVCHLAVVAWLPAQDDEKNRRDDVLPLPAWSAGGEHPPQPDRSLWPEDFDPNEVVHPATAVSPAAKPSEDEIWSRFLPRGLFNGAGQKSAASAKLLEDMPTDAWHACEEMPAETRLFDPQGLLSETQTEDMRRLLSFHTERAGVTAALVLLDARQKLPALADLTHLAGGALTRAAACIVVYPLGEPERTRVFFTQIVGRTAEPAYLENLASTCIREASENPDPVEQVQRFAIQLSIRLFWLERAYPSLQPAPAAPPLPAAPVPVPVPAAMASAPAPPVQAPLPVPPSVTQEQPPLSEVTPLQAAPSFMSRITPLLTQNKNGLYLVAGAVVVAGLLLTTAMLLLRWRRRRLRQCVWILPELPEHPAARLGGPHCGASGAFIQYG